MSKLPCCALCADTHASNCPALNATYFIVCQVCGNKRCPKATDHRNQCSGSNAPGQLGSLYQ